MANANGKWIDEQTNVAQALFALAVDFAKESIRTGKRHDLEAELFADGACHALDLLAAKIIKPEELATFREYISDEVKRQMA